MTSVKPVLGRITIPPPTLIFSREIDDLVAQVEAEFVDQSIAGSSYHDGYLDALKKVQELLSVYGFSR